MKDMLHIELENDLDWVIETHAGYFIFPRGSKIEYLDENDPFEEEGHVITVDNITPFGSFRFLDRWYESDLIAKLKEQGYKHYPYLSEDRNAEENLWVLITHRGSGVKAKRSWIYYCGHPLLDQWGYACWTVEQAIHLARIYISNR